MFGANRGMMIGRTILAVLIAVSLALLPATRSFTTTVKPVGTSMSAEMVSAQMSSPEMSMSEDMTTSDMAMSDISDCCPKLSPCDKGMDDCAFMAGCALNCFGFLGTSFSLVVFPAILAGLTTPYASAPLRAQTSGPPFRPPRV